MSEPTALQKLAPQMLEALEGIVYFADGFVCYRRKDTLGKALSQWINEAESLIEKAKALP